MAQGQAGRRLAEAMLFDGTPSPQGGQLVPDPSRPGLGLELKRADAERYRVYGAG